MARSTEEAPTPWGPNEKRATLSGRPLSFILTRTVELKRLGYSPAWLMCFTSFIAAMT